MIAKTTKTKPPVSELLSNQDILAIVFIFLLLTTPLIRTGLAIFSGVYDQNMWVMGVAFLFGIILLVRYFLLPSKTSFTFHWMDILVAGWFIWLVITTITSYNVIDSIVGVLFRTGSLLHWFALVLIYFAVRYLISSASQLWSYIQIGIILSGTATAILGLIKLAIGTQEGHELLGILGNQNFTAYFLAVTVIITYVYWLSQKRLLDYSLLALIIQSSAIWLTSTRWVYAVLLVMAIIIHFVMARVKQIEKTKSWILSGVWCLLIALLVGSFMLGGRMSFDFSHTTFQHRLSAWSIGWEASKERPIFGWGLENFDNAFQNYFRPEFEDELGQTETFDQPHNLFILHLVTTGWVGLLLFLSILAIAIWSGLKKIKSPHVIWALAVVATYIGIDLLGFETIATTITLMIALAFLGALSPPLKTFAPTNWWSYLSLGSAGLLLVWLGYLVVAPWVGYQVAWRSILKLDLEGYHRALSFAPYLRPSLAYYLLTPSYHPEDNGSPQFYSRLAPYLEENANQRASEPGYCLAVAKAWELSDDSQKYYHVKDALTKGLALYDNNNGYYWAYYANNEMFLGNYAGALEALAKAKALNPNSAFTREAEEAIMEGMEGLQAEQNASS